MHSFQSAIKFYLNMQRSRHKHNCTFIRSNGSCNPVMAGNKETYKFVPVFFGLRRSRSVQLPPIHMHQIHLFDYLLTYLIYLNSQRLAV